MEYFNNEWLKKNRFIDSDRKQPNETELTLIFKRVRSSTCKSLMMYNWAEPFDWKIVR